MLHSPVYCFKSREILTMNINFRFQSALFLQISFDFIWKIVLSFKSLFPYYACFLVCTKIIQQTPLLATE